jgi:hypothetical protein
MLLAIGTVGCRQSGVVGEMRDTTSTDAGANPDMGSGVEQLRQMCRDASFQLAVADCIAADVFPAYSTRCSGVDERVLQMFIACTSAGGCPDAACLALLIPPAPPDPPDPRDCQLGCELQLSFSCITATEHARCFSLCTRASTASAQAFSECAGFLCNRAGCFAAFEAAHPG